MYLLTARRPGSPIVHYLSRHGCLTYDGAKAYRTSSLADIQAERDYHSKGSPYRWEIERLPPRVRDVRRAVPVEA